PVISEPSDDVMEGLMDSDSAVVLDSMPPSEDRGDVGDFVIVEETTGDRSTANKLKYADDNTKTVLRSDSCASETNKLQERDEQSSGEATKIIDLNQKFREKIEMIEQAFIDGTTALRTALIAFRDLMELLPKDIQQRIAESS
ncbi:21150_t:CDS:2, partial [Racocetra persica]